MNSYKAFHLIVGQVLTGRASVLVLRAPPECSCIDLIIDGDNNSNRHADGVLSDALAAIMLPAIMLPAMS